MSEREDQEGVFKVTDRRMFNPDGSMREGIEIERAKPAPAVAVGERADTQPGAISVSEQPSVADAEKERAAAPTDQKPGEIAEEMPEDIGEEIPGEENPASFANFLMSLVSQAAAALGAMPHPVTGQRSLDLEMGKHWIDVLLMLREKTKGNLHPQENRLFEGLLGDLQMQYVQLMRATEERLKQQAAQKFTAQDILGK
jgi:hypothetical protein